MADPNLRNIDTNTWAAAAAEASKRAGEALCDDKGIEVILKWQDRAKDYARRGYVVDSRAVGGGFGRGE